jgi:predicted esterase
MDAPFPSNTLLTNGVLDLSLFPGRDDSGLLNKYLSYAEDNLDGFSLNTGIYFVFDQPILKKTLPEPEETMLELSPVALVNVTPESARFGERIPLLSFTWDQEDGLFYTDNTLILHPVWGFVLEEGATYAAWVTTDLTGHSLTKVQANPDFLAALGGNDLVDPEIIESIQPLADYIQNQEPGLMDRIACGTVFTTLHATEELARMRDYVAAMTPETHPEFPMALESVDHDKTLGFFEQYKALYRSPNFQRGTMPYIVNGGGFEFEESGDPVIQLVEEMDLVISVPRTITTPEEGWPVVIHAHGTGGDAESHFGGTGGANGSPAGRLCMQGFVSVGFDQPMHGSRCTLSICEDKDLVSFNMLNPESARSNFRQGAIDIIFLTAMLKRGLSFTDVNGEEVHLDPARIYFFGHSHGGLTGALAAAVESDIDGYLLSGAGGGLAVTIIERKDGTDYQAQVRGRLNMPICQPTQRRNGLCELTPVHPVLSMIQALVDITDPINYAPHWTSLTYADRPQNLLLTEGLLDEQTPPDTAEAMTIAGRVPQVQPTANSILGLEILSIEAIELPTQDNIVATDGQTASQGLFQCDGLDHFAVFETFSGLIPAYQAFFRSLADGGPATLTWFAP